jgi:hypothetical protein
MAEQFEAEVGAEGQGTFIEVPLDVPAAFGRVRAPVRVTVNGWAWVQAIEEAKRDDTRARRIERAVASVSKR